MTSTLTDTVQFDLAVVDVTTGETTGEQISFTAPAGTMVNLRLDGHRVGDLIVRRDNAHRWSVTQGDVDRRTMQWTPQATLVRRGAWVDSTPNGTFVPVIDGRPVPGLQFDNAHDAEVAVSTLQATHGIF